MLVAAFTWSDLWRLALSIFLIAAGLGLGYAFLRLGGALSRLSRLVGGVEEEILPVINKVGGTVDRVNRQLDKVDAISDSAVDAVESVDTAIRAVSLAVTRPVQKASGFAAGMSHGASAFRARRDWREALQVAKEAARRREQELAEELRRGEKEAG